MDILGNSNVPAFLSKLWTLVEDPNTDEMIHWADDGRRFIVTDQARLSKEAIPKYFKHNNMASFVRQLNMYGFKKANSIESGALKAEKDEVEFYHPSFRKGKEDLLEQIKRKATKADEIKMKTEEVHEVLQDVKTMKGKQLTIDEKLEKMKKENEALWREVTELRQKHSKQQQIVNKLLQFLATLVKLPQPLKLPPKRKMPLMIDSSEPLSKYGRQLSIQSGPSDGNHLPFDPPSQSDTGSGDGGPVISEITDFLPANEDNNLLNVDSTTLEDVLAENAAVQEACRLQQNPFCQEGGGSSGGGEGVVIQEPMSVPRYADSNEEVKLKPDLVAEAAAASDMAPQPNTIGDGRSNLRRRTRPSLERQKSEIDDHVDSVQVDLDNLQSLLRGNYVFDTSMLNDLFLSEMDVSGDLGDLQPPPQSGQLSGNELIQYVPAPSKDNFGDLNIFEALNSHEPVDFQLPEENQQDKSEKNDDPLL